MSYQSPAADDAQIDVAALLSAIVRALPRILLVTGILLAATFVVLMFQPRVYESTASILVEPRDNAYVRPSNDQARADITGNMAGLISSQIELLKSRDTLLNVIDQLDLRSVPEFNGNQAGFSPLGMITQMMGGRAATPNSIDETVLKNLHDRLSASQEGTSALISVTIGSTDPELAARIANALANAHVARRASLSISDTAEASGWLLDEINRLRTSVRDAEAAVADFRVDNDLYTGQNNTSLLDQQLSTIAGQITTSQERKSSALTRASLIRDLIARGQSIEGVPDVRGSVVIQQLSQEKARLQGELAQRSATLLSNHPSIRALTAQVSELDNQIRQEARRVAAALESEAQIEEGLAASLQADLDRAKATASTATRDTVTLDGLQREATAQRNLLEAYLLRYNEASSRVDGNSALPDVRVVSVAAPSVTPASPKTSLVMVGLGFVSVFVQIGVVAFRELMSGRALRPVERRAPFGTYDYEPVAETVEPEPVLEPLDPSTESAAEPAHAQAEVPARPTGARAFVRSLLRKSGPETVVPAIEPEPVAVDEVAAAAAQISAAPPTPAPEAPEQVAIRPDVAQVRRPVGTLRYADLVSDLVLGRTHLVLLADHGPGQPSRLMAEDLVGDALAKGLSVALVDAGTGRPTDNLGLSDLSAGSASFGDVVQKSSDNSFAEVSWGQQAAIDRASTKPLTLTEALGDIYEVVVVLTGGTGRLSMLGSFAKLGGRTVLVAGDERLDSEEAEIVRRRLESIGLSRVEFTTLTESVAA